MKSVEEITNLMHQRLNELEVPQEALESNNDNIQAFEDQLRFIFLDAAIETNPETLKKLKRFGPVPFSLDTIGKPYTPHLFTQKLKTASPQIQAIPIRLFGQYMDAVNDFELNWFDLVSLMPKLQTFWSENIYVYAEDANADEKATIDQYNKKVVQYLIRSFNSSLLNASIRLIYRHVSYPYYVQIILDSVHKLVNLLLVASLIPLAAKWGISILTQFLRQTVEEPVLFVLTENYYFDYIHDKAVENVAEVIKARVEKQTNVSDEDEVSGERDINLSLARDVLSSAVFETRENFKNVNPAISAPQMINVERDLFSQAAQNFGLQHLKYTIVSLGISIKNSFVDEISLKTILLALLRICVGIPVIVCLSLPLVLAELSIYPLIGIAVAAVASSLILKGLFSFITALPGFIYDAGLWLSGYSSQSEAIIKNCVATDILSNFSFYSQASKTLKKFSLNLNMGEKAAEFVPDVQKEVIERRFSWSGID